MGEKSLRCLCFVVEQFNFVSALNDRKNDNAHELTCLRFSIRDWTADEQPTSSIKI